MAKISPSPKSGTLARARWGGLTIAENANLDADTWGYVPTRPDYLMEEKEWSKKRAKKRCGVLKARMRRHGVLYYRCFFVIYLSLQNLCYPPQPTL